LVLSVKGASSLPPSLADLDCKEPFMTVLPLVAHLMALTHLWCNAVDAGISLPPSLQVLCLEWCHNPAPLHHLTRLRSLQCREIEECSLEQLQDAVSAIGASLTGLGRA
jgi:hypothetical protein